VWTATGDVEAAARGYRLLTDYWQRTGNATQLWTTLRNAACLLLDHGRTRSAALLLGAAARDPSAPALDGELAERVRRADGVLVDVLGPAELTELGRQAAVLDRDGAVRLAAEELDELLVRLPDGARADPGGARVDHP
jgi:hypothetical protein